MGADFDLDLDEEKKEETQPKQEKPETQRNAMGAMNLLAGIMQDNKRKNGKEFTAATMMAEFSKPGASFTAPPLPKAQPLVANPPDSEESDTAPVAAIVNEPKETESEEEAQIRGKKTFEESAKVASSSEDEKDKVLKVDSASRTVYKAPTRNSPTNKQAAKKERFYKG
jgi:hypothetical protein